MQGVHILCYPSSSWTELFIVQVDNSGALDKSWILLSFLQNHILLLCCVYFHPWCATQTSMIIILDVCETIFELIALFSDMLCTYYVSGVGEF